MGAMVRVNNLASYSKIYLLLIFGVLISGIGVTVVKADESLDVMQAFTEQEVEISDVVKIEDKKKHQILFFMGVFLLFGVLTTASLGIAMVLFGKQVFIAHMIFAGLSSFLAVAHAVVAIVWFFPF